MIQAIIQSWKKDRLLTSMVWCWYATVITSFIGSAVVSISVPAVGELFPFRVFLPITAMLYLIWAIRTREFVWGELSFLEKVTYILAAVLVVYGVASLPRAIEFSRTFTMLFNLCLDMVFFLLFLRLCRYRDVRRTTIRICLVMLAVLLALGTYEVFFGGIWNTSLDDCRRFHFFNKVYHFPAVFNINTNDYAATIAFLFSLLLLWKLNPSRKWDRKDVWSIVLAGVFSYLVMMAASGRLAMASFFCVLIGCFLCLWIGKQKWRILITVLLLVGLLVIEFANRYYYLMPQIETYIETVTTYPAPVLPSDSTSLLPDSSNPEPAPESVSPPTINVTRPGEQSLSDQFFEQDEETGTAAINEHSSAGVRLRLLIHSKQCFLESYGLGVGLGNTEILARDREVIAEGIWSIHCFGVRLIADYGIFALIPLAIIGCLLLWNGVRLIVQSVKSRCRQQFGFGVLWMTILMVFPLASTAPSDAQDLIVMWIYLAILVLFASKGADSRAEASRASILMFNKK